MKSVKRALILFLLIGLSACSEDRVPLSPLAQDAVILAFGDSLTYGTGANSDTESYPAVLQRLSQRKVINAGIPGEISRDGLARLPQLLAEHDPDLVIICHGGNDILRRMSQTDLANHLGQMVTLAQQQGRQVVLIGVPEFNFGFNVPDLYSEIASLYNTPLEERVLAEIESDSALKSDRVHPNAAGYQQMAEKIHRLLQQSGALSL